MSRWRVVLFLLIVLASTFDVLSCLPTSAQSYTVFNVAKNDKLIIRAEPDSRSAVWGSIPPDGKSIIALGSEAKLQGATWLLIDYLGTVGWVNNRFLKATNQRVPRQVLGKVLNAAGIGIRFSDDQTPATAYSKQYTNKCTYKSQSHEPVDLTVSDEFLEHYRERGFTLKTVCLALATLMIRDVETGVLLPIVNYAIYGVIPLNIPDCFRNGTPLLDCKMNYDPMWPDDASFGSDFATTLHKLGIAIDQAASRAAKSSGSRRLFADELLSPQLADELNFRVVRVGEIEISSDLPRGYAYQLVVQTHRGDSEGSVTGLRIGARETKSMTVLRLPWNFNH
jgi:hypothetical protein